MTETATYQFQDILEVVERWPLQDQSLLIEIMQRRLAEKRRDELALEIKEAREYYQLGNVNRGSLSDLMAELDEVY